MRCTANEALWNGWRWWRVGEVDQRPDPFGRRWDRREIDVGQNR